VDGRGKEKRSINESRHFARFISNRKGHNGQFLIVCDTKVSEGEKEIKSFYVRTNLLKSLLSAKALRINGICEEG
jgi:hypothetical protein